SSSQNVVQCESPVRPRFDLRAAITLRPPDLSSGCLTHTGENSLVDWPAPRIPVRQDGPLLLLPYRVAPHITLARGQLLCLVLTSPGRCNTRARCRRRYVRPVRAALDRSTRRHRPRPDQGSD